MAQLECIAKALGITYLHLADSEIIPHLVSQSMKAVERKVKMDTAFNQLNEDGQQKAVERVEELTEIPRYQAKTIPTASPADLAGQDTTRRAQKGRQGGNRWGHESLPRGASNLRLPPAS